MKGSEYGKMERETAWISRKPLEIVKEEE